MIYSPLQRIMVNRILEKKVDSGETFIYHFITSEVMPDEKDNRIKNYYFQSEVEANNRFQEFGEVLEDLRIQKIIHTDYNPNKKVNIQFYLKQPNEPIRPFKEFQDKTSIFIKFDIVIDDLKKLIKFKRNNYLLEAEYKELKSKNIHIILAYVAIIMSILSFISNFLINCNSKSKIQKVSIDNKVSIVDTLNVKILNLKTQIDTSKIVIDN